MPITAWASTGTDTVEATHVAATTRIVVVQPTCPESTPTPPTEGQLWPRGDLDGY